MNINGITFRRPVDIEAIPQELIAMAGCIIISGYGYISRGAPGERWEVKVDDRGPDGWTRSKILTNELGCICTFGTYDEAIAALRDYCDATPAPSDAAVSAEMIEIKPRTVYAGMVNRRT